MKLSQKQIKDFRAEVINHYQKFGRDMPWRQQPTPYFVFVSEVMLQQTQVSRVMGKFAVFTKRFPSFSSVAAAPLSDVLALWSGLGYNRRAKYIWQAAKLVRAKYGGRLPDSLPLLIELPGIGLNTAGAILAYAFNQPQVFVETNIRTVFIDYFFRDSHQKVSDSAIRELLQQTLPQQNPRQWYWALMDFGAHLKSTKGAQLHRVKNYRPQSRFSGSLRQVRGQVLKLLVQNTVVPDATMLQISDERLPGVLESLQKEGLITRRLDGWHLTQHEALPSL